MTAMPGLQTALLDVLCEVKGSDVVIIIGGGYGIYLKTGHVQRLAKRTLNPCASASLLNPEARSL